MSDLEKFDIMWYIDKGELDSNGLMTREAAKKYAKTLPVRYTVIGWRAGTCESVFQFFAIGGNEVLEIPPGEKLPSLRKAVIMAQEERKRSRLEK